MPCAGIAASLFTEDLDASFAPMLAISQKGLVTKMSHELLEREAHYQTAMQMFHALLLRGVLTKEDYTTAERLMREKYKPIVSTLFFDIDLT